ncbi:MAG: serine hydroxymethyltransferase [Parcubacteria group bacterium]|nr:serine hydroxymethyltransferase [Parcubacteria group bacterium]
MIKQLIKKETARQLRVINLIPSENYVSRNVLNALGSFLTNKYAEGKSHQRYYFGNTVVDEIEDEVKRLARQVFKLDSRQWGVNVQAYSGSSANLAAYLGVLNLGDKILAMSLEHGGHLTHGHKVSLTSRLFNFEHYGVGQNFFLDYEAILKQAQTFKPKLIVTGATAYPRIIDFGRFRKIADEVGALLMVDMSHIAGLVAGGAHPAPFKYADIVTSTTHKTLRGPRGAIIFSRQNLSDGIDKAIFPGLQGGPHLHTIAAIGVALEEALKPSFKRYARQVVNNSRALAQTLSRLNFKIISGGTGNHLLLIDVAAFGLTGQEAGQKLEEAGIIVNKNMIPFDTRKPWDPSGIRLGTPAVTTLGMKEKEMKKIAGFIDRALQKKESLGIIKREVAKLAKQFIYRG